MSSPWEILGLEPTTELSAIRHAYAQGLKVTHPEEDPEGFQRLHDAYRAASRYAKMSRCRESARFSAEVDSAARSEAHPEAPPEDQTEAPPEDHPEAPPEDQTPEPPKQADWDYEQLFAEGQAQQQSEQNCRARAHQAETEGRQRERAQHSEEERRTVEMALHTLNSLRNAPIGAWRKFLAGDVFRNAQSKLDFIWGLEDFLVEHPALPREIRGEIYCVYGFDREDSKDDHGALQPLYNLLYRSHQALRFLRAESARKRRTGGLLVLAGLVLVLTILVQQYADHTIMGFSPTRPAMAEFSAAEAETADFSDAMSRFAEDSGYSFQLWSYNGESKEGTEGETEAEPETIPAYAFSIPLFGGEEMLRELDAFLEKLQGTKPYHRNPPRAVLVVHHGDLILTQCNLSQNEPFQLDAILDTYQSQFGQRFAHFIIETMDPSTVLGKDYLMYVGQPLDIEGADYHWFVGYSKDEKQKMEFYLPMDCESLYCLYPEDVLPWQKEGLPITLDDFESADVIQMLNSTPVSLYRLP